ncbi:hypothetical protein EYB45_03005 [Erythrobacteraceae bacterium CFH 75059]|uniref:hypothetical protein n=1 Tax=Qipengyuania thermophila TaxID=2509361 RepID=UPI001020D22A|nr:hypothetical protein [Qipengyuania thermophila]TCD06680.1 hypothetical protein EYB45_03005 [Erythrobacteraceae bacterium CFH 75059]
MARRSPLDDAEVARFAWARYRRILKWLGALALAVVLAAWLFTYWAGEPVSVHFYIALALGLGLTVMLTGALMGLVFLSSGTGHDEAIEDHTGEHWRR